MQAPGLRLLVPGNVRHNSGGNAYNAALLRALADLGVAAVSRGVDGEWPVGSAADRQRFGRLLMEPDGGLVTLVDGLVACGAPDQLEEAAAAGSPAWILLHMPLAAHPDLERRALQAAAGVICTSNSAAAALQERHGLQGAGGGLGVSVALPGTEPALSRSGFTRGMLADLAVAAAKPEFSPGELAAAAPLTQLAKAPDEDRYAMVVELEKEREAKTRSKPPRLSKQPEPASELEPEPEVEMKDSAETGGEEEAAAEEAGATSEETPKENKRDPARAKQEAKLGTAALKRGDRTNARLHFNRTQKYIGIFDDNKEETRVPISSLEEIYEHTEALRASVKSYL